MEVQIKKITDIDDAYDAIKSTTKTGIDPKATLTDIYGWGHSITRTQKFIIKLIDIPTCVSVHLVRHHVGIAHFVTSNRPDRGGDADANRYSPVNHTLDLNAESIINIARARLCFKASKETREVFWKIKKEMQSVDWELANYMLPNCFYQGMVCREPKPCGVYPVVKWKNYMKTLPVIRSVD